mmetsp:Transcript_41096/g.113239  ORF Transcript_41096/g.113239 Transcript_41096/m.113239 type:complete len:230 (-) Transcript_41096:2-691(-)
MRVVYSSMTWAGWPSRNKKMLCGAVTNTGCVPSSQVSIRWWTRTSRSLASLLMVSGRKHEKPASSKSWFSGHFCDEDPCEYGVGPPSWYCGPSARSSAHGESIPQDSSFLWTAFRSLWVDHCARTTPCSSSSSRARSPREARSCLLQGTPHASLAPPSPRLRSSSASLYTPARSSLRSSTGWTLGWALCRKMSKESCMADGFASAVGAMVHGPEPKAHFHRRGAGRASA